MEGTQDKTIKKINVTNISSFLKDSNNTYIGLKKKKFCSNLKTGEEKTAGNGGKTVRSKKTSKKLWFWEM